ncbi:hypothetical protein OUZ56_005788 [Daphnia magna]|uniref:Uncharacterized protein n=1 Tax=Daphnia magna TaxID=35525 RepID=A0ABQ9YU13_9CRUS|nr:hypothetical protein OUZ56_005788 [Daphnia magna]
MRNFTGLRCKLNYVTSLLHWTTDLDHMSTVKTIMCLSVCYRIWLSPFATLDLLIVSRGIREVVAFWLVSSPSDASTGIVFLLSSLPRRHCSQKCGAFFLS